MRTTKALQRTLGLRHEPRAFSSYAAAEHYATRASVPLWVVLGDCPRFLVCCPRDCAILEAAGYEMA